jgi:hypothetical protein
VFSRGLATRRALAWSLIGLGCVNVALALAWVTFWFVHRNGEVEVEVGFDSSIEDGRRAGCEAERDAERIRYEQSFGLRGAVDRDAVRTASGDALRTASGDAAAALVGDYQTEGLGTLWRLTLYPDGSYESEFCGCTECRLWRGTFSVESGRRVFLQPEPPTSGGRCPRASWDTEPAKTYQVIEEDERRVLERIDVPDDRPTRLYEVGS